MKHILIFALSIILGSCSNPSINNVTSLPNSIHKLHLDSINSGILLNGTDIIATENFLVIANYLKDTIFDVFNIDNLNYLYSDITLGHGPNDILNFRSIRYLNKNNIYSIGLGIPLTSRISIGQEVDIEENMMIDLEGDICQDMYILSDDKILIQQNKGEGEWALYNKNNKEFTNLPKSIYNGFEPKASDIQTFQYRAVNVAIKNDKSKFAFFNYYLPYIRIYDSNGNLTYQSFVEKNPEDYYSLLLEEEVYYSRCYATNDYIFVKYFSSDEQKKGTSIQVWDWDGKLQHLIELDSELHLFTISTDAKRLFGLKMDSDYIYYCDLTTTIHS